MTMLDIGNIIGVLALSGIIVTLCVLYRWIKAHSWLWFIGAWIVLLLVRVWILLKNFCPTFPQYSFSTINTLANASYVLIFLGFIGVCTSLRHALKNGYFKTSE